MSAECRDCRAGLDHCHGTIIRHSLRRWECTEADCDSPELVPHTFVIDCDAVGCGCTELAVLPCRAGTPPACGGVALAV